MANKNEKLHSLAIKRFERVEKKERVISVSSVSRQTLIKYIVCEV